MEVFLIRLLQFMLAISLLVLLHEGGHFFFSKLFGVRVEKFYLFFDPWFHLFEFKPKNSETTYGIGWLPLGGYCKIAGMIDESFDTEQMKQPAQSWEFRSKPAWQRLLIMIGGVLVNFLLALFIYSMVLFYWGETYIQVKDMKMGMKFNNEAKSYGFKDHDILIGTDKGEFKDFNVDLYRDLSTATRADIVRNGKKMSINLPGKINLLGMLKTTPNFVRPFIPAEVDTVMPDSPAAKLGMKKGDRILAIGGKQIDSWNEFSDEIGRLADEMTEAKTHADSMKVRTTTIVFEKASKSGERREESGERLPQNSNLNQEETSNLKPQTSTNVAQVPPSLGEGMGVGSNLKPQTSNLKLLVVEDNPDLRAFLTAILSTTYEVITAENGKEGLEKALQEMPDFIITDVMMPVMDGMTMVHNIKENKDICHIPIIILSAKASLEDKLQGLAEGIDDYITKPFSATYLKHRVENIIAQRHMLQEMYLQQISEWNSSGSESGESLKEESGERREERPNPNPSPREGRDLPLTPPEGSGSANSEQKLPTHSNTVPPSLGEGMGVGFLSSLMSFLDSHLDDTDLKIDDMAAAVSLGRTVFYGKLKSIVGMTPIDFLRHVRLQKAQQLLANSSLNVSEIAYTVGFSDPKYFSKIFRKELGVSPTEYRAQMQKQ